MSNDWIVKGAEVVVLSEPTAGAPIISRSTVVKVNPRTFVLEGSSRKWSRDSLLAQTEGMWDRPRKVVHPDDPKVARAQAQRDVATAESALESAFHAWQREKGDRDKLFAIQTAVRKLDQENERAALVPQATDWLE